mgnify:CR=1 FL=1
MEAPICALSTPMGSGGIAVIRISGTDIFSKINPLFKAVDLQKSEANKVYFGKFRDQSGTIIDEVLLTVFHNPKSYTGEDSIEISCHCNRLIIEAILTALNSVGIRLAEAGEFTKRAFLNGKLDLTQAEAVADLIHANTSYASKNALNILDGKLSRIVNEMRQQMIKTAGLLEIDLDFSEDDLDLVDMNIVKKYIQTSIDMMTSFLQTSNELRFVNEGVKLAIVGQPNAGKSSLLNALLGKDRAIVSDIEGTTRDTIEESIYLNGLLIRLIDTAGIRESSDKIEQIGVEISFSSIDKSDCVVLVVDSVKGFSEEDQKIYSYAQSQGKKVIIAFNKADLKVMKPSKYPNSIQVSAKTEYHLDALKEEIVSLFQLDKLEANDDLVVSNLRHELALKNAISFLENATHAIDSGFGNEIISFDIRSAIDELGAVTGEIKSVDVLNDIFANFCIGK